MTGGTFSRSGDGSAIAAAADDWDEYGSYADAPAEFREWIRRVESTPTGPELAPVLAARPDRAVAGFPVSDRLWAQLQLDSLTHRQRLASHLAAQDAADLAGFSSCYPGDPEYLTMELALALRFGETTMGRKVDLAERLVGTLPKTWDALNAGTIHHVHALVITDAVQNTTPEVAAQAEVFALERAGKLAPSELGRRCRDKVLRLDADAARKRNKAEVARRSVTVCPLNDGMAQLTMTAAAPDVAAAYAAISELGNAAKTPGDDRDAGNRRCDVLLDLCLAAVGADPRPHPAGCGAEIDEQTSTTSAGSVIPAGLVGAAATTTRPHADPAPDNRALGATGATTIGDMYVETGAPESAGPEAARPDGTPGAPIAPAATPKPPSGRPRALVHVTVPFSVLLGSDDPGYLTGIGPISADQARLIAADAVLQRILTDPATGAVLDVGRTTYRPPAHLADHVRARDLTCVAPGCGKPAADCDLDHREPFHPGQNTGGPTSVDNLAPLCRHHHRAKDQGKHKLHRLPDGSYQWTTPLGRRYNKIHAELDPPPPPPPPAPAAPTTPEEPPF